MLIRALIVLLVFLDLGVAAWWLARPVPVEPVPQQPGGVPRLQLAPVSTLPAHSPVASVPVVPVAALEPAAVAPSAPAVSVAPFSASLQVETTVPSTSPAPALVAPTLCLSLGPFNDRAAARAAQTRLQPAPRRVSIRSQSAPARAYSVVLPPLADRATAQAVTQRIAVAGFNDFMIISSGASANGIALGRYGSREAAQRRQADLKAKGFAARIDPVGEEGTDQWWLDVNTTPGEGDSAALRAQAQATRALTSDCTRTSG